jgi:hypothetical protein
MDSNAVEEA